MPIRKPKTPSKLDVAIDNVLDEMNEYPAYDDDYAARLKALSKLYKLKEHNAPKESVSPDTALLVAGNVLIALVIVGFEQKHVVTTKVLGFLSKLR